MIGIYAALSDCTMRSLAGIRFRAVAVLAAAIGLVACAGPTPYQPLTDGYGYSERAIEDDRYRVVFAGNSETARATVEDFLVYRAAEVTLARGYDHFLVVGKEIERSTRYHSTFSGVGGHHHVHSPGHAGLHGFGGLASGTARPHDRYTAYADIVLRRGEAPADDLRAHDARDVIEHLRPAVKERSGT